MEGRVKKYMQVSPERAKVWKEKSPKYHYNQNYSIRQPPDTRKVPVVYYLCRNRQLEHPHFMEVPLSSPDGLYLRDVIERLDVLRGRGMASTYSWSCKRSYKNGFVWHDLSNDDLILPAHGNEYVLKGSEFFEESNSGRFSPATTITVLNQKALPEPPSSGSQEESSSSSSLNDRTTKSSQDDEQSPPTQRPSSSPESSTGKNSAWNGALSLTEYKVYKNYGLADASTQTDENTRKTIGTGSIRGVSTEDGLLEPEIRNAPQNHVPQINDTPKICRDFVSPPSTSSASSSSGRADTLESLIRADAKKLNSFRILEEEEFRMPSSTRLKASNMIMQLISCGSISVKDHSFGLIPTYRPRFSSKFPSPLFSTSLMVREIDRLDENPRVMRMSMEEREYFSGSLVETSMVNEGLGVPTLKRSNSDNAARLGEQLDSTKNKDDASSKCIPRSIKASLTKQPRSESMRSPLSEGPKISLSDRSESSRSINTGTPSGGSKRITEPEKKQTRRHESSRNDKENVIKIEERLASGARVIIQSKVSSDSEGSS